MAEKIIIMKDGLVQQTGLPQEVYDHPKNMFVAGFIGSPAMNFVDVTVTDKMTLKNHQFEIDTPAKIKEIINKNSLAGKDIVMGIRPEDLEDSAFIEESNDSNTLTANVEVTEPMGAEIYVYVDINGVLMTARVTPKSRLKSGDSAKLFMDIEMIHLFDKQTEKAYI